MYLQSEVGAGLKVSLLTFVLILTGALGYFVIRQQGELELIYDSLDEPAVIRPVPTLKSIDTPLPAP